MTLLEMLVNNIDQLWFKASLKTDISINVNALKYV